MISCAIYGRPPEINCVCGTTRWYPIAIGLPPTGAESMCLGCTRLWRLAEYGFSEDGGTTWSWISVEVPSARSGLEPMVHRPKTADPERIAAFVTDIYSRVKPRTIGDDEATVVAHLSGGDPDNDTELDGELALLAQLETGREGHC